MTRRHTLAELVLGIEGLALLRGLIAGTDDEAAARVDDIRRVVEDRDERLSLPLAHPERSVQDGYAAWSATYDAPGNPLIQLEETVLVPLLDELPAGRALDAACGTGRVSSLLAARGHDVLGVDASPEMLARAREKVPRPRSSTAASRRCPSTTAGSISPSAAWRSITAPTSRRRSPSSLAPCGPAAG